MSVIVAVIFCFSSNLYSVPQEGYVLRFWPFLVNFINVFGIANILSVYTWNPRERGEGYSEFVCYIGLAPTSSVYPQKYGLSARTEEFL